MPPSTQTIRKPQKPGEFIASYRLRPTRRGELLGLYTLSALAVLAPVLYGYSRAQHAMVKYGPVAAGSWSRPWYMLAGIAFLVSLVLLIMHHTLQKRRIDVHKNGLLLRLSRVKYLPWNSLAGVAGGASQIFFLGLPLGEQYRATLYPAVGKPLHLGRRTENLPELLTRIKANLYPRLLLEMSQAFSQGQRLYFGPVSINQSGLRIEASETPANILPWSQVRSVSIQSGVLVVEHERDRALRIPVANIPNLELMLQIIQNGVKR